MIYDRCMRADSSVCPYCGQRMLIRYGVLLSPQLADIFDAIARRRQAGIDKEVLRFLFWPNQAKADGYRCLIQAIHRINSLLVSTDYRIVSTRFGPYRIKASVRSCPARSVTTVLSSS